MKTRRELCCECLAEAVRHPPAAHRPEDSEVMRRAWDIAKRDLDKSGWENPMHVFVVEVLEEPEMDRQALCGDCPFEAEHTVLAQKAVT